MTDFYIKKGDTAPVIVATLKDSAGAPINLTGASVRFRMRLLLGTVLKVDAAVTIVDALAGTVSYQWALADTDTAGTYLVEWQITYAGGAVQTVPNASFNQVRVTPRL